MYVGFVKSAGVALNSIRIDNVNGSFPRGSDKMGDYFRCSFVIWSFSF